MLVRQMWIGQAEFGIPATFRCEVVSSAKLIEISLRTLHTR